MHDSGSSFCVCVVVVTKRGQVRALREFNRLAAKEDTLKDAMKAFFRQLRTWHESYEQCGDAWIGSPNTVCNQKGQPGGLLDRLFGPRVDEHHASDRVGRSST